MTRGLLLLVFLALCGCKSTEKSGSRDPLYGRYIPKTDLPIPDRRDPLYTSPTSGTKQSANSEPFRNSKATTAAGLASHVKVEDTGLSMGDRRTSAEPATRGVPLKPGGAGVSSGEPFEDYAGELRRLRARYDAPVRDANGDYVLSATVPRGADGAMKRYESTGKTAAEAAKQLIADIHADDER